MVVDKVQSFPEKYKQSDQTEFFGNFRFKNLVWYRFKNKKHLSFSFLKCYLKKLV